MSIRRVSAVTRQRAASGIAVSGAVMPKDSRAAERRAERASVRQISASETVAGGRSRFSEETRAAPVTGEPWRARSVRTMARSSATASSRTSLTRAYL